MARETLTLDPVDGPEVTNLIENPSFEVDTSKWSVVAATGITAAALSRHNEWQATGAGIWAGRVTGTQPNDSTERTVALGYDGGTSGIPVTGSETYTFIATVRTINASQSNGLFLRVNWYTDAGAFISFTLSPVQADESFDGEMTFTTQAPANAAYAAPGVRMVTATPNDVMTFDVDALLFIHAAVSPGYFDGDSEGQTGATRYRWAGTPHASTSERVNERVDLELHDLEGSIVVRPEGPDWGDAEVAPYMAEAQVGEVPVDFRQANRKVTIPLMIHGDDFDAVRAQLQQKVGLIQREGGWLRRTFRDGRVLYLDVVGAQLGMGGGSRQAMRDIDNEVDLVLDTIPDWYGPWKHLDPIIETTEAEIVELLQESGEPAIVEGDMPGRCRIRVVDVQGVDQKGLLMAFRSRYYSETPLSYEVESFSPGTGTAVATLAGASGGGSNNVLQNTNLSASAWTSLCSFTGTHVGTYRVWMRVRSPSGDDVSLRLLWEVLGAPAGTTNPARALTQTAAFELVDLGVIRIDRSPGGQRTYWGGTLQGTGTAGGEDIQIDKMWLQPLDEYAAMIRSPSRTIIESGGDIHVGTGGVFKAFTALPGVRSPGPPPVGDLPRLPVAGLEERPVELFLKVSRSNIDGTNPLGIALTPDAIDDVAVQVSYQPSWMFAPES